MQECITPTVFGRFLRLCSEIPPATRFPRLVPLPSWCPSASKRTVLPRHPPVDKPAVLTSHRRGGFAPLRRRYAAPYRLPSPLRPDGHWLFIVPSSARAVRFRVWLTTLDVRAAVTTVRFGAMTDTSTPTALSMRRAEGLPQSRNVTAAVGARRPDVVTPPAVSVDWRWRCRCIAYVRHGESAEPARSVTPAIARPLPVVREGECDVDPTASKASDKPLVRARPLRQVLPAPSPTSPPKAAAPSGVGSSSSVARLTPTARSRREGDHQARRCAKVP